MCGITGLWGGAPDATIAERMALSIVHRGPDDAGVWTDDAAGLALAHRRLSILDLSPAGHQPMQSPCGRFVLVYNGEIYNYEDLRVDLEREGGNFCLARPFGYRDPACRAAPLGDSGDAGAG